MGLAEVDQGLGEEGLSFKSMRIAGLRRREWDDGVGLGEPAIMLCRGAGAFEVQSHFGQDFNLEEDWNWKWNWGGSGNGNWAVDIY